MLNKTLFSVLVLVFTLLTSACSATPYKYEPLDNFSVVERAQSQEQGGIQVRASVPSSEEARRIFGIPIYKRGIQPVWLEVTNHTSDRVRLVLVSIDREYFTPFEVAYMHKKYFSKQGWKDMEKYFYENSMPRLIEAGGTASGFVFTNATDGTKNLNVDVFHTSDNEAGYEEFTFFIQVPGFTPDHAEIDFHSLYDSAETRDYDADGLRLAIHSLPCCSTNRDGSGQGKPVNIVLVARGREILQSLLRAGWSESSYDKDDNYLNNVNYLFERPPDAVFRKVRGKSTERNELSLWLAPMLHEETPVWIGQIKHAIGRRYMINEIFFGSAQDPDVDDGRNFLLQNLWYSQCLSAVAFSKTGLVVPKEEPMLDFNDNPFFTDGFRVVMWLSGEPVNMLETRNLKWDEIP